MATRKKKTSAKAEAAPGQDIAVQNIKTAIASAPRFIQDAGSAGNENVGSEDLTIPRLTLLQDLSPETKKTNKKYVKDAATGHMMNSLTKELSTEIRVINLYQTREFPVFVKRTAGGGFKGTYPTKEAAEAFIATQPNKAALEIVETVNHFCLMLDEDNNPAGEIIIPMTSTKLGFSRTWNSMILARGGPRYGTIWTISSVLQSNAQGQEYYNFGILTAGEWVPTQELLESAAKKYEVVSKMPIGRAELSAAA